MNRTSVRLLSCLVLTWCCRAQGEAPAPGRLDRTALLQYHVADGKIGVAKTPSEWLLRRHEIVQGAEKVMGPLPSPEKRCALDVRTEEESDCGSYVRSLITYASEPGSRVPAYLCIPKTALGKGHPAPAVLCLHPTEIPLGPKVVVGLGGKPNRQYAAELAERGFVTISPAYPTMGGYNPDLDQLGYQSGTMKAIWDNIRCLDLLDSLPSVKHGAYGAIGHSLGGHNSVYTAVFDDRIKVVVSSCGLDSYLDYMNGNIKGWTQKRYMPRLADYAGHLQDIPFDFHELIGALAPRAVFLSAPLQDSNFKWASVDRIVQAARQIYALYGVENNLSVEHPDCPHDFPDAMREKAYVLMEKVLK